MAHLIDKDALIAEIERLVNNYDKALDYEAALEDVCNFIDILEVKEVDLEKELSKVWRDWANEYDISFVSYKKIARHFFELGLKAQHSSINIPNIDDFFEKEGIDPNSKTAKIFKESYYMALERLKEKKGE